jgi:hypothetical protein
MKEIAKKAPGLIFMAVLASSVSELSTTIASLV